MNSVVFERDSWIKLIFGSTISKNITSWQRLFFSSIAFHFVLALITIISIAAWVVLSVLFAPLNLLLFILLIWFHYKLNNLQRRSSNKELASACLEFLPKARQLRFANTKLTFLNVIRLLPVISLVLIVRHLNKKLFEIQNKVLNDLMPIEESQLQLQDEAQEAGLDWRMSEEEDFLHNQMLLSDFVSGNLT
jgi:energy-coupling factor transporter transmembrane protein EcfT